RRRRAAADFAVVSAGPLSITCFRYVPEGWRGLDRDLDAFNRALLEAVQHDGRVFLTGTELAGRFALRACIVNFRTGTRDLEILIETIRDTARQMQVTTPTAS